MFKFLDRYIEWLVALAVVYITTLRFFRSLMSNLDVIFVNRIIAYSTIFLVGIIFLYQNKKYGAKIYDKFFWLFYLVYCLYILFYMTISLRYPLEDMLSVPASVINYFYDLTVSLGYLLCAPTIYHKFNLKKYLFLSLLVCMIPSVLFIRYVGLDMIQAGIDKDDDEYIGGLSISYSNMPLIVLAAMNFKTLFKSKWMSIVVCSTIIAFVVYILLAYGKRGPILWSILSIISCVFITSTHIWKKLFIASSIAIVVIMFLNPIAEIMSRTLPRTYERIENTIKEGDTDARFDLSDVNHSTYLIGLENFSRSPFYGYYFRLVTNNLHFRGAYSHNVFIEVLMTMGLIGFVPFLLLLFKAYKKCRKLFLRPHTTNQMSFFILFLCPFLQLQTSNTIVFMYDFWLFFYMLCCIDILDRIKDRQGIQLHRANKLDVKRRLNSIKKTL